jgi:hypothetical protein
MIISDGKNINFFNGQGKKWRMPVFIFRAGVNSYILRCYFFKIAFFLSFLCPVKETKQRKAAKTDASARPHR